MNDRANWEFTKIILESLTKMKSHQRWPLKRKKYSKTNRTNQKDDI